MRFQRSDFLRYALVLFEGGIYTDTDTRILRSFEYWGSNPIEHKASPGEPSLIIGIEADVYVLIIARLVCRLLLTPFVL